MNIYYLPKILLTELAFFTVFSYFCKLEITILNKTSKNMAKPLSILFVSSEVFPFAKVGGISDVSYSLPLALRDLGHDVRVMMPKYGSVSERKNRIHEINRLKDIEIKMGDGSVLATVKSSSINNPRSKVQAYITTNVDYFDSIKGIYNNPADWREYPNNVERFVFFNKSVIDTCLLLGWVPDIIHCNDWQSGMIPGFVRVLYPNKFKKTKIVFTVHNFAYQGSSENFDFNLTDLPKEVRNSYKHKNAFNMLKGGLTYSDYITTVSPTYAKELLTDKEQNFGLSQILKEKGERFVGLRNGIDPWIWNPEIDEELAFKLSGDFKAFKQNNKMSVLKEFGLKFNPSTPVIGMISRLDELKGIPLMIEAADKLMKENLQIILLGEGDAELKTQITKIAKKFPDKFAYTFAINDSLAHKIEAGSDMFLMPSKFEPCGLNLMYSMNYGTIPIVRPTGGINDIAVAFDPINQKGNSFVISEHSADELIKTVKTALKTFADKASWDALILNAKSGDFTWNETAAKYEEIYRFLMKEKE